MSFGKSSLAAPTERQSSWSARTSIPLKLLLVSVAALLFVETYLSGKHLVTRKTYASDTREEEGKMPRPFNAYLDSTKPPAIGLQVHEQRLQRMREVCKRNGLAGEKVGGGVPSGNGYGLLVETEHKIGYCENAKTGCSTWKTHFLNLTGFFSEKDRNQNIHQEADKRFNPLKHGLKDLKNFPTFLADHDIFFFSFVRHPFDRLVSAYEDKVFYGRDPSYNYVAKKVAGKKFSNFVTYVLREARLKRCGPVRCNMDIHWKPYNARCAFCALDYDMIGMTETFDEDVDYIFQRANLSGILSPRLKENPTPKLVDKTRHYFSQLSLKTRRELFQLYKLDFEMFGYSAEEYLKQSL